MTALYRLWIIVGTDAHVPKLFLYLTHLHNFKHAHTHTRPTLVPHFPTGSSHHTRTQSHAQGDDGMIVQMAY